MVIRRHTVMSNEFATKPSMIGSYVVLTLSLHEEWCLDINTLYEEWLRFHNTLHEKWLCGLDHEVSTMVHLMKSDRNLMTLTP